jgi:23S rRNA (pseudouridine1915-N3)-methyltransferase
LLLNAAIIHSKLFLSPILSNLKISIWSIGKTDEKYLKDGIDKFLQRLGHYKKVDYQEFKDVKHGQTSDETLRREATMIFEKLKTDDFLILLDERGTEMTSVALSQYIEKLQNQSTRSCILLIGGAFGHHTSIKDRANASISLSKMTFSHQMVRLFLAEQLYRAFTIIKNEKYHNE